MLLYFVDVGSCEALLEPIHGSTVISNPITIVNSFSITMWS
jgi:hypothetical protein